MKEKGERDGMISLTQRELEGSGFHRGVKSEYVWRSECKQTSVLIVREEVPATAYIDFDEVKNLRRLGQANVPIVIGVGFEGSIDVERPANASSPHSVAFVATELSRQGQMNTAKVRIPLHLRYQSPQANGGFRSAKIFSPTQGFLCCSIDVEEEWSDSKQVRIDETMSSVVIEGYQCNKVGIETAGETLQMEVPVGKLEEKRMVTDWTEGVTFVGAIVLVALMLLRRLRLVSVLAKKND